MSGALPDQRVRVPVSLQRWDQVAFVHWRYPVAVVQRLLPRGLVVDQLDGAAWVGVTPFVMRDLRLPGTPPAGGWSTFHEVNVRTYVRHPASGTDGVWFFSLLCPRAIGVAAMRVAGLPYTLARGVRSGADHLEYRSATANRGAVRAVVRPGAVITDPSPWLVSVTGRWNAYSRRAGRLWRVPVEHQPWPLHAAEGTVDTDLLEHAGLPRPAAPPHVAWSPGVDVRIGLPRTSPVC